MMEGNNVISFGRVMVLTENLDIFSSLSNA